MDEQGLVREFNPAAEQLFGLQRHAAVGRLIADVIVPPHHRAAHAAGLARLLATGQSRMLNRRVETEGLRADGSIFPIELAIVQATVDHERLFIAYLREITDRRQAEEKLRQSEQRFRAIIEDQSEFILRIGPDLVVTFVNHAFATQVGLPVDTVIGTSVLELVEEHRRGWFVAQLRALTPDAPIVSYETVSTGRDGARAWEHWMDRAIFDGQGRLLGYQSVGRDVSAAKQAEEALRQSEQRFRAVIEDQTELICRFDADFRLTFSNLAHARIFGKTPDELIGQYLFDSMAETVRAQVRAQLLALTPDQPMARDENEKILPDGEVHWFEWTNRALFDPDGLVVGYQCVGRDITERRVAEAEIARQREALHQQEKLSALGSLLAGVAHELNNPLAVVVGRAIMLEEEVTDPGFADSVGRLRVAAERCASIVKTFLVMARQRPHERRQVAVDAVLNSALDLVAYGLRTAGIEVVRKSATPSSKLEVLADEDQLHQVFLNLLVNAQQALLQEPPPRRITLSTSGEGTSVEIAVADNGPGIPAAIHARIFEPFFTTKPQGTGTGVGLSICHAIIVAHGGTIEADAIGERGARFTIRPPLAPPPPMAETATTATPAAPAPPARILVVDDEPEILAMVGEILRKDGYHVQ